MTEQDAQLRDTIAREVLTQLLSHALSIRVITHTMPAPIEAMTGTAYAIADAMLRSRQRISEVQPTTYEETTDGC